MVDTQQQKSHIDWFFDLMESQFGKPWTDIYKPKHTRAVKAAKATWQEVIRGHDREVLKSIVIKARAKSPVPPSAVGIWNLLSQENEQEKKRDPDPPRDRALGEAAFEKLHAVLGKQAS